MIRTQSGIAKYEVLKDLAIEYGMEYNNYTEALKLLKECNRIAYEYCDSIRIVASCRMLGQLFNQLNKPTESERVLMEALPIANRFNLENELVQVLNNLAIVYLYQDIFDKALVFNFKSLELSKKLKDIESMGISLNNIGVVYYKIENYNEALLYYERSLQIKNETINSYDLDRLLINMSICYLEKNNIEKAQQFLNRAFSVCKKKCSDNIIMEGELAQGMILFESGNFNEAEIHFRKSYEISTRIDDNRFPLENIIYLSKIYLNQEKIDQARKYLDEGERLAKHSEFNTLKISLYEQISTLYTHLNDFKNTARYQAKYIQLRDSIYSEELTQNLMIVQAEYEQRENKSKIEAQNKILKLKEAVIDRQSILNILAAVTVMLLSALIVLLYRNNLQKKKTNQLLEQKVQERTKALALDYETLQRAYEEQTQFIRKASNEIRSPIVNMNILFELALQEFQHPKAQEYVEQMNSTSKQLSSMMDKLCKP